MDSNSYKVNILLPYLVTEESLEKLPSIIDNIEDNFIGLTHRLYINLNSTVTLSDEVAEKIDELRKNYNRFRSIHIFTSNLLFDKNPIFKSPLNIFIRGDLYHEVLRHESYVDESSNSNYVIHIDADFEFKKDIEPLFNQVHELFTENKELRVVRLGSETKEFPKRDYLWTGLGIIHQIKYPRIFDRSELFSNFMLDDLVIIKNVISYSKKSGRFIQKYPGGRYTKLNGSEYIVHNHSELKDKKLEEVSEDHYLHPKNYQLINKLMKEYKLPRIENRLITIYDIMELSSKILRYNKKEIL